MKTIEQQLIEKIRKCPATTNGFIQTVFFVGIGFMLMNKNIGDSRL